MRALHSFAEHRNAQLQTNLVIDVHGSNNVPGRSPYPLGLWILQSGSSHSFLDTATDFLRTMTVESGKWSSPVDMPRIVLIDCHMVLLAACCPLTVIRTFSGWHASQSEADGARKELSEWLEQDGALARQAVLHSAIIYCKVREKPSKTFYESSTFLLAVLTLWAYGRLFSPPTGARRRNSTNSVVVDRPELRTARLGHAFNTEQARQWIQEGQSMRGYLEGVGNIWSDDGPRLILHQAIQTLNSMSSWGISQRYAQALDRLDCSKITRETITT